MKVNKSYEITDAKISFISLVGKAANKRKFLIMKQEQEVENVDLKEILKNGRAQITEDELDLIVEAIANRVIEKLAADDGNLKRSSESNIKKSEPHYLHGIL